MNEKLPESTRDHSRIKRWVDERQGAAATTHRDNQGRAVKLSIEFPSARSAPQPEQISWDEFFEAFDRQKLVFRYQERAADGTLSQAFELSPLSKSATAPGAYVRKAEEEEMLLERQFVENDDEIFDLSFEKPYEERVRIPGTVKSNRKGEEQG